MTFDARLNDLIAANPNLEQQMRDWQTERHQKGEDPFDWNAFRTIESYISAVDPGESAPAEFYWFSVSDAGRAHVAVTTAPTGGAPSSVLVSPATLRASAPDDTSRERGRAYFS